MSTINEAMAQALAAEESTNSDWVKDERYSTKEYYSDADVSIDMERRTIGDISENVSTVGENNAQYISFIMDRYIDSVDLKDMTIQIQAEASADVGIITEPVNVYYNETHIRFGWSIPQDITQQAATIKIIVFCTGTLSDGNTYTIKTLPLSYEIKDTLVIGGFIPQPSENWYLQFVTTMNEKVTQATTAATTATQNAERVEANILLAQESAEIATQKASDASIYANDANASANAANTHATTSDTKAKEASSFAILAESYAHGSTNVREDENIDNAKYYYEQAKRITQGFNGIVNMGTVSFEDLPTEAIRTNAMYNISTAFVSDERFRDGGGIFYGAGNNVVWTTEEKWDVLASSNVTGIKGSAESEYRQGNVDITPANLGINIVNNTKDEDKNVNHSKTSDSATKATQDSDGNAIVDFYATKAESNSQRVSATAIGTNPTIQDSTNAPLIYGKFKGYTLQDGEPTPDNPVEINGLAKDGAIKVKTKGKNIFGGLALAQALVDSGSTNVVLDTDAKTVTFGYNTNHEYTEKKKIFSKFKENTQYTFILDGTSTASEGYTNLQVRYTDGNTKILYLTDGLYVSKADKTIAQLEYEYVGYEQTLNYEQCGIFEGVITADEFEPYTETTTAITTGAPLYEGDYIEIYADGSGKEYRKMKEIVLDKNVSYIATTSANSTGDTIYFDAPTTLNLYKNKGVLKCVELTKQPIWLTDVEGISYEGSTGAYSIRFRIKKSRLVSEDVAGLKAWLAENPLHIAIELATPTETPLTTQQVAQFKQLYTFEPVTNVFCDGEVELLYYKNTDSGETVGIVHKKVEKNERAIEDMQTEFGQLPNTFAKKSLYDDTTINVGRKADTTVGEYSTAEGYGTTASNYMTHSEGHNTTASGMRSHAEGHNTTASETSSHAEGSDTTASGTSSHAEGYNTTASGISSHAEGSDTIASGISSHTEGSNTTASGTSSHAEGNRTIARGISQHVQGKYNVEDTENKYAHIVGGGTSNTERKNIHTLDWEGNAVFAGDVVAHDESGDEISLRDVTDSLIKVAVVSLNYECGTYDSGTDQYKGFIYNTDITIDKIEGAIKIIKFIPFAAISTSDAGRAGTIGWRESDKSLVINFSFSTTATVSFLVFYI